MSMQYQERSLLTVGKRAWSKTLGVLGGPSSVVLFRLETLWLREVGLKGELELNVTAGDGSRAILARTVVDLYN